MNADKPAALEMIAVSKVFRSDLLKGKQVALDSLTCRFQAGACTGLLGANGAGKTTTIRLILGLIRQDAGEILFEGKPLKTETKRFIGYMPEVNRLPLTLTPHESLHHQLKLYAPEAYRTREARAGRVDAKLTEVGLGEHRNKRIGHMSKGMARRLAWALATVHSPRLLILDEPSSGLDPYARKQMLGWIESEKRRGSTIVLCTHELAQVSTLCDDLQILRKGRLVLSTIKGERLKTQGGTPEWRHRYAVQISGADELALRLLKDEAGLQPWQGYRQEGFVSELGFAAYSDASQWLGALIGKGLLVLRFGDETYLGEDDLLPYFHGEG